MFVVQVEAEDSWKQEFSQEAVVTLDVVGVFHDLGTIEGEADTADTMQYAITVGNTGSVTLIDAGESKHRYNFLTPSEGLAFRQNNLQAWIPIGNRPGVA